MKRGYVGPKQLTIENTNFFDYSVTLFGDTSEKNISYKVNNLDNVLEFEYWNPDSNPREINIYNELLSTIKEPFEIMAHDYKIVSQCNIPKNAKLICKNSDELIKLFNNKTETRNLFKGIIPTLDYTYVKGKDFNFKELSPEGKTLVVQHPLGSGGSKTFLCKKETEQSVKEKLLKNETYAISTYLEDNIPYNIHCVIGKNNYEIFPPSMQELDVIDKIEYIGSFYDIKIENKVKQKFIDYTKKICEKLQELGYLGVLGIDYIYANNELYFIEINPRFQGSTRQLDKILIENNLPSLFEYNYLAFKGKKLKSTKDLKNSIFNKEGEIIMNKKYETFKKYFDKDELKIEELEYLITEKCNLNCVGYCSEGGPGKCSMTPEMIDASMKPFKEINILKILGGEPSLELDLVQRIYDNIIKRKIKVNEVWFFTNGVHRDRIEKMLEIFAKPTKLINAVYVYVSRGKYHDRSMRLLKQDPQVAEDNLEYFKEKYKGKMFVEKQWDEERPLNVGHARNDNKNPIRLTKDTRNIIMFGDNKIYKVVFSPKGYERPFFCNPEDVESLSFGHIIDDGMEAILVNGLRFNEMTDEIIED